MKAEYYSTSHPTSCAIFTTRGALFSSSQPIISYSLPILKMISLSYCLENLSTHTILWQILSKPSPRIPHHFCTKHNASTSSPMDTIPYTTLQIHNGSSGKMPKIANKLLKLLYNSPEPARSLSIV